MVSLRYLTLSIMFMEKENNQHLNNDSGNDENLHNE